ncbi:MAG: cysteine desulfurase-like protein [Gemmataceae bacterium]
MFDVRRQRAQFPALNRQDIDGLAPIFLDGPGGTQVPQRVIEAMVHYLTTCNANHGGLFATSRASDAVLHDAQEAVADFLNAPSAAEVVFGPNMTTLTWHLSRAIGRTLRAGDEVVVSKLDHDANVRPWVRAATDAGATVRWVDIHPEDGTLNMDDLCRQLGDRTRLVAVTCASNAIGSRTDVRALTRLAHDVGAWVFLDAVHYAPHGPIDVQDWDCDFLACSAYKFFGPHVGILWGKRQLLEQLPADKLMPVPDQLPDRWMTGTQNHEGIAGVAAALDYLADLGATCDGQLSLFPNLTGRRQQLHAGLAAIQHYETLLARQLLQGLAARPRFRVWGITDLERLPERVPTVSITSSDRPANVIAEHLAARNVYVWNGNMYAWELTRRLGLEETGGFCRLGLVHYNTLDEVERLLQALDELPRST